MSETTIPLTTISPEGHPEEQQPLTSAEDEDSPQTNMPFKDVYQKAEGRKGDVFAQVAAIASLAVLVGVTWFIALWNPAGLFTWHPLCQSLGIALISYVSHQGVLTLQPTSQPRTKAAGLIRHQIAMIVLGYPILLIGTAAVSYNKYLGGRSHFTSWHGTIGIITIALTLFQVGLGAGSVWFNGRLFGGNPKAKLVWKYHRASGYLLFPLYLFTTYLGGAWSNYTEKYTVFFVRLLAYFVAPVVLAIAVYSRVR
ncbi:hypothetical protein C8Q75DRAFT_801754 [Abortiporus biennis]|nr:hypothetical protein C8Q75DRAFT_801754 [Abortiporus biennis]